MNFSRPPASEFTRPGCKGRGFTLIELLIILAVIAVLATIAYPSYQFAMRKAKRAEAKSALLMLMQQQERYYTQRNSYIVFPPVNANDVDAGRFKTYTGTNAATSAYSMSGVACASESIQNCVLLIASPVGSGGNGGFTDPDCNVLSLTSAGVRSATGTLGDQCW